MQTLQGKRALVDLNEAALRDTAAAFDRAGTRVRTYVLDVTDTSRIVGLREEIARDGGRIDVLVNNAGLVFGGGFLDGRSRSISPPTA